MPVIKFATGAVEKPAMISPKVYQANLYLSYSALATGILALSFSAMFVRWASAPGPITGLYRVFLSSLILTPFFLYKCRRDCNLRKSTIIFPLIGGLFTAGDFALWNTSVHYTTEPTPPCWATPLRYGWPWAPGCFSTRDYPPASGSDLGLLSPVRP